MSCQFFLLFRDHRPYNNEQFANINEATFKLAIMTICRLVANPDFQKGGCMPTVDVPVSNFRLDHFDI